MPRPEGESCGTCRFWEEFERLNKRIADSGVDESDVGQCRRYPLTVTDKGVKTNSDQAVRGWGNAQFPRIRAIGWCGEWQSIITDKTIEEVRSWVNTNETAVAD